MSDLRDGPDEYDEMENEALEAETRRIEAEPYVPEPLPETDAYHDLLPARCPHCGRIILRTSLDAWRCTEHGVVRPWYGRAEQ